jgi:hypothetical protein
MFVCRYGYGSSLLERLIRGSDPDTLSESENRTPVPDSNPISGLIIRNIELMERRGSKYRAELGIRYSKDTDS